MRKLVLGAIACSVLSLSGCGTFVRMGFDKDDDRRFSATRTDVCVLKEAWGQKCESSAGYFEGWKLLTLPAVIDLPFALVLDGLLFPFDAYSYSDTRARQETKAKSASNAVANMEDALGRKAAR